MARLHVGLTGGIASGKSAVADRFAAHGVMIIDADLLAREVVAPGTEGLVQVRRRFGDALITSDDQGRPALDRPALGKIVFADSDARRDLESIIHPAVRRRAAELAAQAADDAVVMQVIPLLVETGQQDAFDLCVVVDVDEETQLRRLINRDGLDEVSARQRIAAQISRAERRAAADLIIDNTGDRADLDRQVAEISTQWQLPN